jgi:hypothetical protein
MVISIVIHITIIIIIYYYLGDVIPTTRGGRLFTAWYIIFGVCILGTYISMITNHIQEHNEKLAALRDKETVKKIAATTTSRSKYIVAKLQKGFSSTTQTLFGSLSNNKKLNNDNNNINTETNRIEEESAEKTESLSIENHEKKGISLTSVRSVSEVEAALDPSVSDNVDNMLDISTKAFDIEIQNMIKGSYIDILIIFLAIVIAMVIMHYLEDWHYTDAFYFTVVTISTVGYGDFHPTNDRSRVFIIFYTIVGTGLLVRSCTNLVKIPILIRTRKNELDIIRQFGGENLQLTTDQLKAVFEAEIFRKYPTIKRNESELSKAEFVILLLSMMDRINEKDLILACKLFDKIDRNDRRFLHKDDINLEIERISVSSPLLSDVRMKSPATNGLSLNMDNNLKGSLL